MGLEIEIDRQIKSISAEAYVHGSAITVSNMIKLVEEQENKPRTHANIVDLFTVDRQIVLSDFMKI